jgi:hypothetical protein
LTQRNRSTSHPEAHPEDFIPTQYLVDPPYLGYKRAGDV